MQYFVIGDEDTVLGFSLVGVFGMQATDPTQAKAAWDKAISDTNNGIIIITQPVADMISSIVDKYLFTETFPLVVVIPGPGGEKSKDLRSLVNDAIGISL
ncbi:MAG: V-type ATP synthase subunit F [Spirochaetia bacterium]|jgi:V/A-type H+-transporting ATPase subunit F|nr:V-type ATP synthase subunit F [Spirochaetia bacterium]